jgi:hypothetical protein
VPLQRIAHRLRAQLSGNPAIFVDIARAIDFGCAQYDSFV